MFEMIPPNRMSSVKTALQTLFGKATVQQTTQLIAGSQSIILKLILDDMPYILRVMDLQDNLSNRKNQIQCLKTANELGLGPSCLYSNVQEGLIITEYIYPKEIIVTRPWLSEIADSLQILHSHTSFPEAHQPLFDYMRMLSTSLGQRELSPLLIGYLDTLDRLMESLTPHIKLTSCHNDLNFTNLLYNGKKTYFIDWEAAGQEDPFFDIATICNEFITNDEDRMYFLTQYFNGMPSFYQQAKVLVMRQISYCYLAIHYLDHAANAGLALNQNDSLDDIPTINEWQKGYSSGTIYLDNANDWIIYALTKVKASLEQMQSKEFISALNQLEVFA